jgi:hypothetical protein
MRLAFETAMSDAEALQRATIPVETIDGPLLMLSGEDDRSWPCVVRGRGSPPQARGLAGGARGLSRRRTPHHPTTLWTNHAASDATLSDSSRRHSRADCLGARRRLASRPRVPGRERRTLNAMNRFLHGLNLCHGVRNSTAIGLSQGVNIRARQGMCAPRRGCASQRH